MKRAFLFAISLYSSLVFANPPDATRTDVEYLKICTAYGGSMYYIPGSDTCMSPDTGQTLQATDTGTKVGQSQLAWRISRLEQQLDELGVAKSETPPPSAPASNKARVQYVEDCSATVDDAYYAPGTDDTCVIETTGQTVQQTPGGNVTGQTRLAWRVSQLEQRMNALTVNK